ncbi:aminotransferase class III-fold pyridoxal phosphate-dependent enzyme [Paenibacillus sp. P26]|nr:aminotransferase class III-fold pyridoxal phosphate-dependent enzyme [Paenibacillus sp. P26]
MTVPVTTYPMIHPLKIVTAGNECTTLVQGERIYVRDTEGRTYMDGISGLWNVSLGYGHPALKEAIIRRLDLLPFANPVDLSRPACAGICPAAYGAAARALELHGLYLYGLGIGGAGHQAGAQVSAAAGKRGEAPDPGAG